MDQVTHFISISQLQKSREMSNICNWFRLIYLLKQYRIPRIFVYNRMMFKSPKHLLLAIPDFNT